MADIIDYANDQVQRGQDYLEASARRAAAAIPPGEPGACDGCGEDSPRLVTGLCGYCRDGRRRPF